MMDNYEAWSEDKKYGLRISEKIVKKILGFCVKAGNKETGGILVGYYNQHHDCAIVTDCSSPPIDSQHEKDRFYRGIRGRGRSSALASQGSCHSCYHADRGN